MQNHMLVEGQQMATETARRLRELRERRGWSQEELGAATGYTRSMICKMEKGERGLSPGAVIRLARILRVPVRELFA